MSGLYDTPNGILDPKAMALAQMGMGLMQAGGPSRMPVSLGQGMGQAGMQGMQAFQQTNQSNQQQQMYAMKMAEAQRAEKERVEKEAALAQLMRDPRFANMGPLLKVAPQQAIERAFPKDNKPMVVAPGGSLVDPENPQKPLFQADPKAEHSPLSRLLSERDALPQGHPNRALYDQAITSASTKGPLVNVDNRQEGEFAKKMGGELAEQYSGLQKADFGANQTIQKYQRLGGLLNQSTPGKFTGTTVDIKAAAKGLGIDLNALGIKDDVAPAQAARALSNQLALELRNPAGGAGMPGAMSDQDREFLLRMIPSLENDPGAIKQMIDYRVKIAQREQQVAKMARAYKKKNGKFDEDFYDELADWSSKNHLFPAQEAKPTAQSRVVDFGSLK